MALATSSTTSPARLPPTSAKLAEPTARPYFLWWLDATVADLRAALASDEARTRGYFLGALLREANSRDVWLFTNPEAIRRDWEWILPHLGRSRKMWGWLLDMSAEWPPRSRA